LKIEVYGEESSLAEDNFWLDCLFACKKEIGNSDLFLFTSLLFLIYFLKLILFTLMQIERYCSFKLKSYSFKESSTVYKKVALFSPLATVTLNEVAHFRDFVILGSGAKNSRLLQVIS
jgi:hypothetical protein